MNTGLIAVDMQNGFCHPDGSLPRLDPMLADVDREVRQSALAVAQARAANLPVIFTRHVYRPGRADEGSNLASLSGSALAEMGGLAAGSWDGAVVDGLGWTPADLTVDKARFDAFLWTSMDPLLQGLGVEHLLVCGVVTNVCVESTVRAAFMRDYRVTLLGDCCAAPTTHEIGLEVMGEIGLATVVNHGVCHRHAGCQQRVPGAAQPVEPVNLAWRVQLGHRRRRRGRHVPGRAGHRHRHRHRHRGQHPAPGRVLRHHRAYADVRFRADATITDWA